MLVYLDNSATTQPYSQVLEAMVDCYNINYGNPSSLHKMGVEAEKKVKVARNKIAASLKANNNEIIFTSGGTESNNTAIFGSAKALKRSGKRIITTCIEHPSVLNACKVLEEQGIDVKYLGVDGNGLIDIEEIEAYLNDDTSLVTIMHANNEVGTIQPIQDIGGIKKKRENVYFHVDAVQTYSKIPIFPKYMEIDLLSISAHKIHGPKGIGGLYLNNKVNIPPLIYGGQQENRLRSGTENVPGIVGFEKAVDKSFSNLEKHVLKINEVKAYFLNNIKDAIKDIKINSFEDQRCVPHILNISFLGVKGEVLLHMMEQSDIFVSTGSACSSKKKGQSHVLKAMGLNDEEIEGAIRFSFSEFNSIEEMDYVLEHLEKHVKNIRKILRK